MTKHEFFQEFGGKKNENQPRKILGIEAYVFNTLVFELYANWNYIIDLMYKYRNGLLKQVPQLDAEWITFIMKNNIDVSKYIDDEEKFLEDHLKKIT